MPYSLLVFRCFYYNYVCNIFQLPRKNNSAFATFILKNEMKWIVKKSTLLKHFKTTPAEQFSKLKHWSPTEQISYSLAKVIF
jgi:hypothetical protein